MSKELRIPADTLHQQFEASNPQNSSWVSANAGSGKTHVLTQRVIRLMLDGNPPDKILCLTFTKAAAANMKNRVFDTLGSWTMMEDMKLDQEIEKSTGKRPSPKIRRKARELFASALDTPGGLKIQTIHGFCESLLRQFPIEANVPGHFEALEDNAQVELIRRATKQILSGSHDPEGILAKHFEVLMVKNSDIAIEAGIAEIITKRGEFLDWVGNDLSTAIDKLYKQSGISRNETDEQLQYACLGKIKLLSNQLRHIHALASESTAVSDQKLCAAFDSVFKENNTTEALSNLRLVLLTGKDELRKRIVTKHVTDQIPDASDILFLTAQYILEWLDQQRLLNALKNSENLFTLGLAIIQRYEALKRSLGAIDYDDQIQKAATLLNKSDIQDWIRYRLDQGVDHVLVDEAQDTSPAQWSIINALTADFNSGETASKVNRTVFVVGDEKQSIFSFQGAEPAEFELQQKRLQLEVKNVNKAFHPGRLALSFRSTKDVLHAVDRVFENPANASGLSQSGEAPVHDAVRANDPGEVQIWPIFEKVKVEDVEDWMAPVDAGSNHDPVVQLANRIADEIGNLVGKPLPGMDRPLKFGDILVLVRKRDRFITALTRTMKDKGLEIAGADRLLLTEHIAVEDLIALGRVALMPDDDLSLACVLKGLMFNLDEEALFAFAYGRGGMSLYQCLRQIAHDIEHEMHAQAAEIIDKLEQIIWVAHTHDVFNFYALILGKMNLRRAILARLGLEAEDVLDAFLDETLTFAREKNGGLEAFIAQLTAAKPEIKREVELERDQVRILTVHASKGLEARLVFLVDPCGEAWDAKKRPKLLNPDGQSLLWVPDKQSQSSLADEAIENLKQAAQAEYRRLLYVGMTRAADRLVVCGYKGTREIKHDHWHKMVEDALRPTATELFDIRGEVSGLRWVSEEKSPVAPEPQEPETVATRPSIPDWLFEPVKADPPLPRPLTPSGAHALIEDVTTPVEVIGVGRGFALARGNAIHKLLEMLPDVETEKQDALAQQYLAQVGSHWTLTQREEIAGHVIELLQHPIFAAYDDGTSMAEVSLSGIIESKNRPLLISGQIDRLIVMQNKIHVLDYKSNQSVPTTPQNAPAEYITQLALYREMVRQIYPEKHVECSLLWTQTPEIMQIRDEMLDEALLAIKNR